MFGVFSSEQEVIDSKNIVSYVFNLLARVVTALKSKSVLLFVASVEFV